MALISCDACGAAVSANAKACPGCGHPSPEKSKGIGARTLLAGACMVAYLVSQFGSTSEAQQLADKPSAAQAQPADAAAEARKEAKFQKVVAFVKIVKASMRDPESFKLESVGSNSDASIICMEYRAKNGFGGYSRERVSFSRDRLSQEAKAWNRDCAHKNLDDMGHVEYAL